MYVDFLFFFSSRRRNTRLTCDSSSDVCSSDLETRHEEQPQRPGEPEDQVREGRGGESREQRRPPAVAVGHAAPNEIGRASCRERMMYDGGVGGCKKKWQSL